MFGIINKLDNNQLYYIALFPSLLMVARNYINFFPLIHFHTGDYYNSLALPRKELPFLGSRRPRLQRTEHSEGPTQGLKEGGRGLNCAKRAGLIKKEGFCGPFRIAVYFAECSWYDEGKCFKCSVANRFIYFGCNILFVLFVGLDVILYRQSYEVSYFQVKLTPLGSN